MLKPIKKMGQPKLFRAVKGQGLTGIAHEVILENAIIKSEGVQNTTLSDGPVYSGSTMLTIELSSLFNSTGLSVSPELVADFVKILKKSINFKVGLMRLAREEAERRCSFMLLGTLDTELEFKVVQDAILIDIDVCGQVKSVPDVEDECNTDVKVK